MTKTATPQCPSLSHSYSLDSEIWNLRPVFMIVCGTMWPRSAKFEGGSLESQLDVPSGGWQVPEITGLFTYSHTLTLRSPHTKCGRVPLDFPFSFLRERVVVKSSNDDPETGSDAGKREWRAQGGPFDRQQVAKFEEESYTTTTTKNFAHTCDVAPRFGHVWGF